ncbi:MAG: nucleotidyltransferase family protein [Nitrospirae bacterium]|nr:nucleotidyltransferase family protein [Nitrospirota bacterium]
MGKTKQLLPLSGRPLIAHCLDTVLTAGIRDIIVVLGHNGEEIAKVLSGMPVHIIFNELQNSEMADSARKGLSAVAPSSTGIIIYPSDYPLVKPETIMTLAREHNGFPDRIVIPVHGGKRGHPTLFPREAINELVQGATLRDIINRDAGRNRFVSVTDSGVLLDVDTKEDYLGIVRATNSAGGSLS